MITWPRTIDGKPVAHYENLRVALEYLDVTVHRTGHPTRFEIYRGDTRVDLRWLRQGIKALGLPMRATDFLVLVARPAKVSE